MIRLTAFAVLLSSLMVAGIANAAPANWPLVRVPWIGCPSDGQQGPERPPPAKRFEEVQIDPSLAPRLAYYASRYSEGLGPRGWHCLGLEGSNGVQLLLAKAPLPKDPLSAVRQKLHGPAVVFASMSGETSGRFDVAIWVMRYFPRHRVFADAVIAEGLEPASNFPAGVLPGDRILSRTPDRVVVETPPHRKGEGADSWLAPDDLPIISVVRFDADPPGGRSVSVKLAPEQRDLLPVLLGQL